MKCVDPCVLEVYHCRHARTVTQTFPWTSHVTSSRTHESRHLFECVRLATAVLWLPYLPKLSRVVFVLISNLGYLLVILILVVAIVSSQSK